MHLKNNAHTCIHPSCVYSHVFGLSLQTARKLGCLCVDRNDNVYDGPDKKGNLGTARLSEISMGDEVIPVTQGSTEYVDVNTGCSCTACFLVLPFSSSLGEKLPGSHAVHLQQTALRSTSRGFDLAEEFQNCKRAFPESGDYTPGSSVLGILSMDFISCALSTNRLWRPNVVEITIPFCISCGQQIKVQTDSVTFPR